jgi:CRISPR/Cas system-associated exonuclease Cas4 (RecB family)
MEFAMAEFRTGKRLATSGAAQVIDASPDAPVNIAPSLQLAFQVNKVIADIER